MISSPCKTGGVDCPKRIVGCHAKCSEYLQYAKQKRVETVHTNKEKASLNAMWDYNGKGKRR